MRFVLLLTLFVLSLFATAQTGPYAIKQEHVYVTMKDGVKLWACKTFPVAKKKKEKFPGILAMDPYYEDCRQDRYSEAFLASSGYYVFTFHVRGTGKSEGILFDREYSEQEIADAVTIIDWMSKQSWCNGNAGMFGGSWSAFNSLQTAMRKPKALKAIISYVGTEDLYNEDVHYADGIMRFDDYLMLADMFCYTPPPLDALNEKILQDRFDQPPLSLSYLKQQRDGDFWRKKIRLNITPDTLKVPVLMIGGWYDGYRTAILRALQNLKVPAKAIVGPWDHSSSSPEPSADLKKAELRWWDYWLKKKQTGVIDDPDLTVYMQRSYLPQPVSKEIPGQWQTIAHWPPPEYKDELFYLNSDKSLSQQITVANDSLILRYIPSSGSSAGIWWGNVVPDQRSADAFSLVFESAPLKNEMAILGQPVTTLLASATAPHANWYVKLSDVAPDGTTALITGAGLNGTHRNSAERPEYLEPGKSYSLKVPLHFTAWVFQPGHKIRVSVTNALFPMFWPTPYNMNTTLFTGTGNGSQITLPVIPLTSMTASEKIAINIGSRNIPSVNNTTTFERDTSSMHYWPGPAFIERDELKGTTTVSYKVHYKEDELVTNEEVIFSVQDEHPADASMKATIEMILIKDSDTTVWRGSTEIKSDVNNFNYRHERKLYRNEKLIREKEWKEAVKRDFQ